MIKILISFQYIVICFLVLLTLPTEINGVLAGSSPKTTKNDQYTSPEIHQAPDSGFRPPRIRIALEA